MIKWLARIDARSVNELYSNAYIIGKDDAIGESMLRERSMHGEICRTLEDMADNDEISSAAREAIVLCLNKVFARALDS
jgi:hypothetical protein